MTLISRINKLRNKALEQGREVTHLFVGPSDDRKLCSWLSDCDIVTDTADGSIVMGLNVIVTKRELIAVGTLY